MSESFSVNEWCARRRVSRSFFYEMQQRGEAPRTYRIGNRQRITTEADAEWIAKREAEAAA
jgi:predicted DNA-binding transcriptional regulator AlpA